MCHCLLLSGWSTDHHGLALCRLLGRRIGNENSIVIRIIDFGQVAHRTGVVASANHRWILSECRCAGHWHPSVNGSRRVVHRCRRLKSIDRSNHRLSGISGRHLWCCCLGTRRRQIGHRRLTRIHLRGNLSRLGRHVHRIGQIIEEIEGVARIRCAVRRNHFEVEI